MALSIIEFGVYGFVAYSSLLMLIISTIKEVPNSRQLAIVRAIFLIPGAICMAVISNIGNQISSMSVTNTIVNLNTTETFTESYDYGFTLENPIWVIVHFLFFIVIVIYIIQQILTLWTKYD